MSENDIQETVEQIDEMEGKSSSAATLKPNGKQSKSELLATMMRVVGGMKKDDLSAFLDKTLEQVGKEDDSVPATAAKNQ